MVSFNRCVGVYLAFRFIKRLQSIHFIFSFKFLFTLTVRKKTYRFIDQQNRASNYSHREFSFIYIYFYWCTHILIKKKIKNKKFIHSFIQISIRCDREWSHVDVDVDAYLVRWLLFNDEHIRGQQENVGRL